jgi:hypothetical protein
MPFPNLEEKHAGRPYVTARRLLDYHESLGHRRAAAPRAVVLTWQARLEGLVRERLDHQEVHGAGVRLAVSLLHSDGIVGDTIVDVAMTLRLDADETEALRRRAELEQRSMQEVARQAIREYVENHSRADLLGRVLDEDLPRYAEALERLGQ